MGHVKYADTGFKYDFTKTVIRMIVVTLRDDNFWAVFFYLFIFFSDCEMSEADFGVWKLGKPDDLAKGSLPLRNLWTLLVSKGLKWYNIKENRSYTFV